MASNRTVIVGAETLLGREIRDVASGTPLAAGMRLVDAGPETGPAETTRRFTEESGEAFLLATLDADAIGGAQVVFLAGSEPSSRKTIKLADAQDPRPALIDLTHALEDESGARLRAPSVEGVEKPEEDGLHVIAHPAAVALAVFLKRLRKAGELTRVVVQVFEPASERGQSGINELQQQTISLLSFKPLSKDIYDAQLSFNMLARFGEDAPQSLQSIEERIERHLASLLAHDGGTPMPSLRLIQVPVFHGYSMSIWAEFQQNPGVQAISEALASVQIEVRGADEEPPSNVGVASQSGIVVGVIETDRNNPQACWFWLAADNLRIAAEEAVAVARGLLEQSE
jgi:aspartate-semialdehyde dehydrogenase